MSTIDRVAESARLHALVRGRVQGVYFRGFIEQHANALGLAGWARNLPDGMTVEIVAEGPREALEALLARLRQGPPGSSVQGVDVEWSEPHGEHRPFFVW